jgi:uncharacterized protein YciI
MTALPPIRRSVWVDADPETAFAVFTGSIDRWWPLGEHSVHGDAGSVAFVDGELVETSASGERSTWGEVLVWDEPLHVGFTWHPGHGPERASRVDVVFAGNDGRTLVSLTHSGWEAVVEPAATREEYGHGWPGVLERFGDEVAGQSADPPPVWFALVHRPSSSVPAGASVVADPRFRSHLEFLERMRAEGLLVAAGPLADGDGEGMTVLRLRGGDGPARAGHLAREVDESVAGGLLNVTVREWRVALEG